MKPSSKLERRVWELHPLLPDLTLRQFEWARGQFGQTAYFNARKGMITGTYRCTECGHEWSGQANAEAVCPNCGATLKVEACKKKKYRKCGYFVTINEIAEFVIFRYWWFDHLLQVDRRLSCEASEVMQIWNNQNGNEVVIARNKSMFNYYKKNIFSMGTPMSIKRPGSDKYYYSIDIRDIGYEDVYTDDLPKRMSYVSWEPYKAKDVDTVFFMKNFLKHPMVETLMKAGKRELLAALLRRKCFDADDEYRKAYIKSTKLALNHGYFDEDEHDPLTWVDFIKQLVDLNLDWHNPIVALPKDLDEKHTEYSIQIQKILAKRKLLEDLERNKKMQAQYDEQRKKFFKFQIREGEIIIQPLKTIMDFFVEGGEMHHCVYSNSYYDMGTHSHSLILSARKGDDWNKPKKFLETIEINLKTFDIIQSRGHCNKSTEFHDRIVKLVEEHMNEIKELAKPKKKQETTKNAA